MPWLPKMRRNGGFLLQTIGIIGGTGVYDSKIFKDSSSRKVATPYGDSGTMQIGDYKEQRVVFLPRHGKGHTTPPHMVNYRANIYALKEVGVERIIAINSVGGINQDYKPGDMVIPHDFIDLTRNRASTFYDNETVHMDMTRPYCSTCREILISAARKKRGSVFENGVYVATEGPRFETPAEIIMIRRLGGDMVGMTGLPEAVLAREMELCYGTICTITNYAAGIGHESLTTKEVIDIVKENEDIMKKILIDVLENMPENRECGCKDSLKSARL